MSQHATGEDNIDMQRHAFLYDNFDLDVACRHLATWAAPPSVFNSA